MPAPLLLSSDALPSDVLLPSDAIPRVRQPELGCRTLRIIALAVRSTHLDSSPPQRAASAATLL
ncbi:MAG TPA: hypothetical protein VGO31_07840 [Microbacteriaceae bacterium]|nr:hypothetical protein [Microbacteriaceae bacterium]